MKGKRILYKILVLVAWLMVGSGMIILLAAANKKQKQHVCKDVVVSIKGSGEKFYIEEEDILRQLEKAGKGVLKNKPVTAINLSKLEKTLKRHSWIKEAQLYFDSRNVLHVSVTERVPIARVFTSTGQSFYIDSAAHRMPLLDKVNVRLPVITNFSSARKLPAADSALLKDLSHFIQYINKYAFWPAQLAQIDITPEKTLEAIPVVGNHMIRLGTVANLEKKLNNLLLFYEQVLSKTGFDKYKIIDVQFEGQVVGVQKGTTSRIDSIQLKKNIEELMKQSEAALADSLAGDALISSTNTPVKPVSEKPMALVHSGYPDPAKTKSIPKKPTAQPNSNPNAVKTKSNPQQKGTKPVAAKKIVAKKEEQKPKAVMKRTN